MRKIERLNLNEKPIFQTVTWADLYVGDIIKVNSKFLVFLNYQIRQNQYIPADILLLHTSEKKGECYIETKSLDGETNLKFK